MIAASFQWQPAAWLDPLRLAPSLGLFAGHPANAWGDDDGRIHVAQLLGPRAKPNPNWQPGTGPRGETVLFEGTLDNRTELTGRLGLDPTSTQEAVFAHAVARWGDGADSRCVGDYAAIVFDRDGSLRMSRSPWAAPSLFYVSDGKAAVVSSIPRPIFAAGWPKRLRETQLAETLFWIENAGKEHWYEGMRRVPYGTVVRLTRHGVTTHEWYDPLDLAPVRFPHDEDYVEQANRLLAEATAAALRPACKPAMLLSGGLDSAIVADEMLRRLPGRERLRSYTFVPLAEYAETDRPGHFSNDRSRVKGFAGMHPRLDPTFCDNVGVDFDAYAEQFFAATDAGRPAMAINAAYHGPVAAAAKDGCDWVFDAAMGNNAFSNDGRWAYIEFARTGRWGELWRMARDHPGDTRPMWRRLLARSVVPHLPPFLRDALRRAVHGRTPDLMPDVTLLKPEAIARYDLVERARTAGTYRDGEWFRSREEWLRFVWRMHDMGAEWRHGVEQVFGIRHRDVTAYRPLLEFCAGLPTDQFVRGGSQRWLARRMAQGRMPQMQQSETDYGRHNVDWHLRMTRRLPELRAEFARMAGDPALAELVDTDAAFALLDRWPKDAPDDPREVKRHFHAVTGAILTARFHRFYAGING